MVVSLQTLHEFFKMEKGNVVLVVQSENDPRCNGKCFDFDCSAHLLLFETDRQLETSLETNEHYRNVGRPVNMSGLESGQRRHQPHHVLEITVYQYSNNY